MVPRPRITLLVDPRFPGGTSSAVAQEVRLLAPTADLRVAFLETRMFKGREVNSRLQSAILETGIPAEWQPPVVRGELVVVHNPSALKFEKDLPLRLVAERVVVVCHENLLRPNGKPGFDIGHCLGLLQKAGVARDWLLAPVSQGNRETVAAWCQMHPETAQDWQIAAEDWFNICDFPLLAPTPRPRDRRGRLSRPGFEKFPDRATLMSQFPPHAEHCAILGGDSLLLEGYAPPTHWKIYPFGSRDVDDFLREIDFFIYSTHPSLRESFGRVLAEAIAAGKVVITDAALTATFGEAVLVPGAEGIDPLIARLIADPDTYARQVRLAQQSLARFGRDNFLRMTASHLHAIHEREPADAFL